MPCAPPLNRLLMQEPRSAILLLLLFISYSAYAQDHHSLDYLEDKILTMAFDIYVTDSHGNIEKSIPLFAEDYDYIMNIIEQTESFLLLKKVLADFYGENEIYLNDLEILQAEIALLKKRLTTNSPSSILDFVNQFLDVLRFAIANRRTIKFAGD